MKVYISMLVYKTSGKWYTTETYTLELEESWKIYPQELLLPKLKEATEGRLSGMYWAVYAPNSGFSHLFTKEET